MPPLFAAAWSTKYDWRFTVETNNNTCKCHTICDYPRGKILGGSSAFNFMLYIRGNYRDFDYWAELGNRGWGFKDVLPYFKKSEHNHCPHFVYKDNGRYHSDTGHLNVDFFGNSPF